MNSRKASKSFIENCYILYEQKMYQIAFMILHDEQLAEDAVSEAFLKLMKSDTCFEDVKSDDCKRYIITVIKHASITIYNKKKREREVIYFTDDDTAFDQQDDQNEEHDIDSFVEKLPQRYKEVVECLVQKNLTVKETSKVLGITEDNVRKRFERAKHMLVKISKGSGDYEGIREV